MRARPALATLAAALSICVALFYPYGALVWQPIAMAFVIGNAIAAVWAFGWPRGVQTRAIFSRLAIFALVIPPYFIVTTRQHNDELVAAHFDGTITKLYRSSNHQYPAIEIDDPRQGRLNFEPLPEQTWSMLTTGDQLRKETLSTFIRRGTECMPIVEPSSLHAIRGARTTCN
jgi:hypothetical protein